MARLTAALLGLLGEPARVVLQGDSVYLTAGALRIAVTRACTYLDLALILVPFVWRIGGPRGVNFLRVTAVGAGVALLDVTRLGAAVLAHAEGAGWGAAHDLPDAALYYVPIAAAVILCARRDRRMLGTRQAAPSPHG